MQVVNINRREQRYTHYIGRPGPFGNPYHISLNRQTAIENYERYARGNPQLLGRIKALPEDAVLGCFCAPAACHGDVIIKLWKELNGKV